MNPGASAARPGPLDKLLRRPVAVLLAHVCMVLLGLLGWIKLPSNRMPDIEYPTIVVTASLPGSTPDMMANSVAAPLESRLCGISGLLDCTTGCVPGSATLSLRFRFGVDMGNAMGEVGRAIKAAADDLPGSMPDPPSFSRFNPTDTPILYIACTSPSTPPAELGEQLNRLVANPLRGLPGVSRVKVDAGGDFSWVVRSDARELACRGLSPATVQAALKSAGMELPGGQLIGAASEMPIQAIGPATAKAMDLASIPLPGLNPGKPADSMPIWVSDVADVAAESGKFHTGNWFDGKPCAILMVYRESGFNALEVADRSRELLERIGRNLPAGARLEVVNDNSLPIRAGVDEMEVTLGLSLGLVLIIIGIGLRDWRGTVVACSVVPVTLVTMFGLMWLWGFSLNSLTLLALCLAIGFVVDDAVVVLENIIRHREMGKDPVASSVDGAREVAFTMASITVSLLAVFLPVLLIPDMLGRMFREFALTLMGCITLSGVVSLLLIPVLCQWLPPGKPRSSGGEAQPRHGLYQRCLSWLVGHPWVGVAGIVAFVYAALWIAGESRKGFLPEEDRSFLILFTKSSPQASWRTIMESHEKLRTILESVPEIEHQLAILGQGDLNVTSSDGLLLLKLIPPPRRNIADVTKDVRERLARDSSMVCHVLNLPSIFLNTKQTKSLYQVLVTSPDSSRLPLMVETLAEWMRSTGKFTAIDSDIESGMPSVSLRPRTARLALSGLSVRSLAEAANSAFGPVIAGNLWADDSTRFIRAGFREADLNHVETLQLVRVDRGTAAGMDKGAPLTGFSSLSEGMLSRQANRYNRLPSASISFNIAPGADSSSAISELKNRLDESSEGGDRAELVGLAREVGASISRAGPMVLLSFMVMYLCLGFLYESLIHPVTVLATLPSAMLGGFAGLWIMDLEMDLYGFFGLLMLLGLVKKNAIMLVDFARQRQREGATASDAILEASRERLRPIQLTTLAAAAGAVPMLAGWDSGNPVLKPVGAVLLGGLLVSQVVTLVLTPPLYKVMDWLGQLFQPKGKTNP